MPTKRPQLIKGEFYHVILRGIENRKIFLELENILRFILDLANFDEETPVFNNYQNFLVVKKAYLKRGITPIKWDVIPFTKPVGEIIKEVANIDKKKPIVEILALCLMPTHVHLLLCPLTDKGISLFIQKLGGYSTYFNKKYNRFGSLFQRPFKVVHIKDQEQLEIVICYIHTNPLELIEPGWKEKGIRNLEKAMKFLENYWPSSLLDYLGKENLSGIISTDFINKIFKGPVAHREWISARLSQKKKMYEDLIRLKKQNGMLSR